MQIPKLSAVNNVALFVADQHEAQINKKMHVWKPIHENTSCCSV